MNNIYVIHALLAAALFGASTPFAKLLVGEMSPWLLAGLLYLGSGLGLAAARLIRDRGWTPSGLVKGEWPWLLGAIFFGGILGPLALMFGLTRISGSTASLLLNLEAVLTAAIAWVVFKENADRRIVLGMLAIVAGGVVLSWSGGEGGTSDWVGPFAIAAGCLCWAIDNNLTRRVSASDALFIAGMKGAVAGTVNVGLAFALGASLPSGSILLGTMAVGLLGYGISLVLFVLALRGLGTARTGAYFSTAPFIGAAVSLVLLGETTSLAFWIAAALMGWGCGYTSRSTMSTSMGMNRWPTVIATSTTRITGTTMTSSGVTTIRTSTGTRTRPWCTSIRIFRISTTGTRIEKRHRHNFRSVSDLQEYGRWVSNSHFRIRAKIIWLLEAVQKL